MTVHIVRQGECLSSIAHHYGVADWRSIYDHTRNAALRAKRANPNLMQAGDELYIPDVEQGGCDRETDRKHTFVTKFARTFVSVRVQDSSGGPLANVRYKLVLETIELTGSTDAQGWIRKEVPAPAEHGVLLLWPDRAASDDVVTWKVALGHLDPLETTTGLKARLRNLGYDIGEVNEQRDALFDCAVRQFQRDHQLTVDGSIGPSTLTKLKDKHGV